MFLVFSADSFYQTAENFRKYTAKCGVGFSRTNTAHNIWSEIVAGENQYAKIMGKLNAGSSLESYFCPESFISIMQSHQRIIVDKNKATEIFAESIHPQIKQLCPPLHSALIEYSDAQKYCFYGSPEGLAVFEKGLPGYLTILHCSEIEYERTQSMAALCNYILGHDAQHCFDFFASACREAEKTAEFELEVFFRTNRRWLVSKLAIDVLDTLTHTYDFEELRESVYESLENSIQEYRDIPGVFPSFLDIDKNIVTDLIDLISAGLVSDSKWYIESDINAEEVDLSQIEFTVEKAFKRLLPKSSDSVIS